MKQVYREKDKTTNVIFSVDLKSKKSEKSANSVTYTNDKIAGTPVSPTKVNKSS